jgi:hypothetical protein
MRKRATMMLLKQGCRRSKDNRAAGMKGALQPLKLDFCVDSFFLSFIIQIMRWQAVIVLLAILLSIVLSPALSLTIADGGHSMIGTLDVCHSATPALSSNGDMPCLNECPRCPFPLAQHKASEIVNPPCKPLLIAFQDERPPKV